jgi:hypothetical protein
MLKGARYHWIALASSLLLLAAVFFIISREQSLDALIAVWHRTDAAAFLLAILFVLIVQALSAWRVRIITMADGLHAIRFLPLFRIQLTSQFVAHGAPISALSDIAKVAMLKLRFTLSAGRAIRLVLYERVCGALGAVVVGVFATFGQLRLTMPPELIKAQFLLWGTGCVGIVILLALGSLRITTGISLLDWLVSTIIDFGHLLRRPAVVAQLVLASIAQLLGLVFVFMVLARGMHLPVDQAHILLFMPLIFFVSSLPVFYLGWGGREAIVVATIGSVGTVTAVEAVALSVAFGVVVFLASLPGAVFWILRPSMRKAVRMEAEQS